MVEEIKQTFRGQVKGSFESLFTGIVLSKSDKELIISGNYPMQMEPTNILVAISDLNDISVGATFTINNKRHFIKGEKRRTRYFCTEFNTKKQYLINGVADVLVVSE